MWRSVIDKGAYLLRYMRGIVNIKSDLNDKICSKNPRVEAKFVLVG